VFDNTPCVAALHDRAHAQRQLVGSGSAEAGMASCWIARPCRRRPSADLL